MKFSYQNNHYIKKLDRQTGQSGIAIFIFNLTYQVGVQIPFSKLAQKFTNSYQYNLNF